MSILKRFVSYYKPYRHLFYLDCLCATVLCIIDLSFPQILRWLPEGLFSGNAASIFSALRWLFPALLICVTMLCFNLMGDGLRDALDPRMRQ